MKIIEYFACVWSSTAHCKRLPGRAFNMLRSGRVYHLGAVLVLLMFTVTPTQSRPPEQTGQQKAKMEAWRQQALTHSKAAAPHLLRYLDSPAFRMQLRECCPAIANSTAIQLFKRVNAEIEVAELTHNFVAGNQSGVTDTTLHWQYLQQKQNFFFSIWEAVYARNITNDDPLVVLVEQDLRGYRRFTGVNSTQPKNFAEAEERPIYAALNSQGKC